MTMEAPVKAFIESLEPWISLTLIVIGLLILLQPSDCAIAFYPDGYDAGPITEQWT